jgi:RimJ/RimL family protein N-acetyltransferase
MKLRDIKEADFSAIKRLTKNKDVMKFIGNGKIWDDKKIKRFIDYNLSEQKLSNRERKQFYYIVENHHDFIGIIGFHLFRGIYVLTVFFYKSKQGRGYFGKSLKILKKKIKIAKPKLKYLYVQVHTNNQKMLELSESKFFDNGIPFINNKKIKEFIIFI